MATRISQMLLQQVGNSSNQMGRDLSELATRQRDVQYRQLALQDLLGVDLDALDKKAEELQIKDFSEASAKEDLEKNYTEASVVAEDSVVIITTKVEEDSAKGILRSKLVVGEIAFPQLKEDLMGKKAGDSLEADINGTNHEITVLAIRTKPPEPEIEAPTEVSALPTEGQNEQQPETNG